MKRANNLYSKIICTRNILAACKAATSRKRFKSDVADFIFNLENEVCNLHMELTCEVYHPMPYKIFNVFEPKERRICCSHIRDRVVHHAICRVLDPIFEKRLIFDTYACRVGRGTHRAVLRAQHFCRRFSYFLKCDISKYFQSIDHECLKLLLARIIKDKKVLSLLDVIIDHPVPDSPPAKGLPIGNLTSQHFANLYLGELDLFMKNERRVKGYVRYMDDFIVFGNSKEQLREHLLAIEKFVAQRLKLLTNKRVEVIAPVVRGLPFLGFNIFPKLIRIKRENIVRMRRKIKSNHSLYRHGKISEGAMINSNRSMLAHIEYANTLALRRKEFSESIMA